TGVETIDKNWDRHFYPADTVVKALGLKSRSKLVDELAHSVAETYIVGDCNKVRAIHDANHSAFNYAVEV
ncbi:MAG: hypothetical protein LIP23_00735, partial [Planctomycetes bacterium]|nr:hypothetical protein [Planctomycetota bacterium]